MLILDGSEIAKYIENFISPEKQIQGDHLELTVAYVKKLENQGFLDFGGSEYKPSDARVIDPIKKNPEDKYGWWFLNTGGYLITFNEKISPPAQTLAIIAAHERLSKCGIVMNQIFLTKPADTIETLIQVSSPGLYLKQNAKVAFYLFIS